MIALLIAASVAAAPFDPVEFFRGRTHGEGTLKIIFQNPKPITVDSDGTSGADGVLTLKQVINEPGKAPRTRVWKMRREGPARFSGTLTDAAGPVRVEVEGRAIRIRYKGKDSLDFDQRLTPVGSRELRNHMRIKRFGVTVARVDETIRKVD